MRIVLGWLAFGALGAGVSAQSANFHWPTPNRAFAERKSYEEFVQPTESGRAVSGLFGCVRSGGRQFHEGLDLLALNRDRRGEPTDEIFSVNSGIVRYVNRTPGWSDYGRYVVIEHPAYSLGAISLYAHLASVERSVEPDASVEAGQRLGVMGRSAASYSIPRERAHLHLELGVWLSTNFQSWYDAQRYRTRNRHGIYNGFNVVGLDYLDFVERQRAGEVQDLQNYVVRLPVAVSVVIREEMRPDFVQRYPALVAEVSPDHLAGWQIDFTWFGLPKYWRPLTDADLAQVPGEEPTIVFHDAKLLERYPCQSVVQMRRGSALPGPKLRQILAILFSRAP